MLANPPQHECVPTLVAQMNESLAAECDARFHPGLRAAMPRVVALLVEEHGAPVADRAHELRMVLSEHLCTPTAGSAPLCDQNQLAELVRKTVHAFNTLTNSDFSDQDASHWFG